MAELVDAQGLGSCLFKGGGSSPPSGILSTCSSIDNILLEFCVILLNVRRSNQFSRRIRVGAAA